jgi:WXG100 family type VII secretion target
MSLNGLYVNHAGLEAAADDLGEAVRRISERLELLDSELAPLRSDWAGHAQRAYAVAKAKWDAAMDEMKAVLVETSGAVRASNAEYRAADLRGAAAFGG